MGTTEVLGHALLISSGSTEALARAVAGAGCDRVTTAPTASAARALLADGQLFDVVVLDLAVGDGDGFDIPTIVIANDAEITAGTASYAFDYVTPPVNHHALRTRVRNALHVRALEQTNRELVRVSCVDPLTGLANRRHALATARSEFQFALRHGLDVGVVLVDLDMFHDYNERHGHLGGDACLRAVSAEMARCLRRPSDLMGRYGGEEFIAVLPATNAAGAHLVAQRLRESVAALGLEHGPTSPSPHVTVSVGFAAMVPRRGMLLRDLIATADAGLLRAKAEGRDRVCGEVADLPLKTPGERRSGPYPVMFAGPWLVERVPEFLAERRRDAKYLARAVDAQNFDHMTEIGERFTRASREIGFEDIAALGREIEAAARSGEVARVQTMIERVERYVERVQVIYRQQVDERLGRNEDEHA